MASTRYLTTIPTTQPTCGPLTLDNPSPQCNGSSSSSSNDTGAMGCFVQSTGLYCAPLSTTRGFLYTLDPSNASNGYSGTTSVHINLIPRMSIATTTNNSTNGNNNSTNPPLGVDGQPVLLQDLADLGQTCVGIPVPPQTDPIWTFLVTMANKRLNETVGSPGLGAGPDVLSLRGDCEAGAYCDFSQSSMQEPTQRRGICKEQLPNYHSCSSYFECISLHCDNLESESSKSAGGLASHRKRRYPEYAVRSSKRRVGAVCLPPKSGMGEEFVSGHGNRGQTEGTDGISSFPMWAVALIVLAVVGGAVLMFVLVRRRRRHLDGTGAGAGAGTRAGELPYQTKPKMERMRERERERTLSSTQPRQSSPVFTRASGSGSSRERIVLPKVTTTFLDHSAPGLSSPSSSKHLSLSSSIASSAPRSQSSAPSTFSYNSVLSSPSSFPTLERFQDGELPSRLPRAPSVGGQSTLSPTALTTSPPQLLTRTSTRSSTLIPPPVSPLSPTIPVSPISPISPPPPYSGTSPGGSSRLSSRNSYQVGSASYKRP
ncbi:hypothetical protein BC939DRAFT_471555 [Gamsiella multidivaricata]|uniref:uncharacterized protein n=1 Tax=Gamsiella multidivaricata TaxID=101098 RepID=UPI00221F4D26|nr:uncharacterized protein BC939DRAFT_471555 [Gamsiella multidivaricata]KAI7815811.1 hypothetical protein BC939DRAFT_471555 [Gamsiella multidivaricata]